MRLFQTRQGEYQNDVNDTSQENYTTENSRESMRVTTTNRSPINDALHYRGIIPSLIGMQQGRWTRSGTGTSHKSGWIRELYLFSMMSFNMYITNTDDHDYKMTVWYIVGGRHDLMLTKHVPCSRLFLIGCECCDVTTPLYSLQTCGIQLRWSPFDKV